jgi:glyoxylase-like metal-dependent hydrolase (beta-lactamase superfamily II)
MNIVNVGYDSTNYYMLADHTPRLLVDAGWPGTLGRFQHQCERMGVALPTLKHMLVTHFHPDHAGLVRELSDLGLTLILPDVQAPAPDGVRIVPLALADSRAFLATIGIAGEILHTPGHSDDSVTLVLDEGAAFTGDLTPASFVDDPAHPVSQSWQAIREHGATAIYPGHGPMFPLGSR